MFTILELSFTPKNQRLLRTLVQCQKSILQSCHKIMCKNEVCFSDNPKKGVGMSSELYETTTRPD